MSSPPTVKYSRSFSIKSSHTSSQSFDSPPVSSGYGVREGRDSGYASCASTSTLRTSPPVTHLKIPETPLSSTTITDTDSPTLSPSTIGSALSPCTIGSPLHDAYARWKKADDAIQRLPYEERVMQKCRSELQLDQEALEQYRAQLNPPRPVPKLARRKHSMANLFGARRKNHEVQDDTASVTSSFYDSPIHEIERLEHLVQEHESLLITLREQISTTKASADTLDDAFVALWDKIKIDHLPAWRYDKNDLLARAERSVDARDKAYIDSQTTTMNMYRARKAIQSAHLYYKQALDICDSVCNPKKSVWESMMGDEQSRNEAYRESGRLSSRAQVCFNECLRALEPHMDLLKKNEMQWLEELRESGLMQASRLYGLMYGGRALDMGITQQVRLMMLKQEAVYERLTNLAVWVQNCTVDCETVRQETWQSRNAARREMVSFWVQDCA